MVSYVRGSAPTNNVPTIGLEDWGCMIGIEFATKTITLPDGGKVKAQIWDTGCRGLVIFE